MIHPNNHRDTGIIEQKWQEESDAVFRNIDRFKTYFVRHKRCTCKNDYCNHYYRALMKVMGERIDKMYRDRMYIGMRYSYDALERRKS